MEIIESGVAHQPIGLMSLISVAYGVVIAVFFLVHLKRGRKLHKSEFYSAIGVGSFLMGLFFFGEINRKDNFESAKKIIEEERYSSLEGYFLKVVTDVGKETVYFEDGRSIASLGVNVKPSGCISGYFVQSAEQEYKVLMSGDYIRLDYIEDFGSTKTLCILRFWKETK